MAYDAEAAQAYEAQGEHTLPHAEGEAWLAAMADLVAPNPLTGRALDIGAGTGLLTAVLKGAGLAVTGLEPSRAMIAQGVRANACLSAADFVEGDADRADLFPPGCFDWIVSRQVLCHLSEPERCFHIWHSWLKPGGYAILVDGCWRRSGWSDEALASQPFAAMTSATPVADAMRCTGFTVLHAGVFDTVNAARRSAFGETATRYVVVATR